MEETLHTDVRNETQESPTFGKRFKWVELETFVRLEHELQQHAGRPLILFFPANTAVLSRPVLRRFKQKMRASGRDLVLRHLYFRESHTWWTLLLSADLMPLLDNTEGFPTAAAAQFTRRGGRAGDFHPPFTAPECTSLGDKVQIFPQGAKAHATLRALRRMRPMLGGVVEGQWSQLHGPRTSKQRPHQQSSQATVAQRTWSRPRHQRVAAGHRAAVDHRSLRGEYVQRAGRTRE